jgi:hypothetical protein
MAGTANEAEDRHGILSLRQYRLLKFVFTPCSGLWLSSTTGTS